MVDRSALGAWIQPQHLEEDSLRSYREAFQSHPARMVVLENFLVDKMADRLTRFLSSEAEFGVEYGLYSVEGAVSEEDWGKAEKQDRFFRLSRLAATPPQFQMSPNTLTYLKFRQTFQRPEYKAFFEELSGLPLGASDDFGVHSMSTGDFLRPHSDDNRNRRVALVIYLSPDWQPSFGGALHLIDKEGNAHPVEPRYNSMVVFDTLGETTHLVEPITSEAGDTARLTIGGWYHNPN
jgi:Rps23 Pro-64 3,4-dihydroxylase Tpa1-like proline 4-hydroxylase